MKLSKYDNKCIRLEDIFGDVYEGICSYNNRDYNMHEYGKDEECLQMSHIMFFKSIIKSVVALEDNNGPYGVFSNKYGKLEEAVIEYDLDLVDEVFDSEEDISIIRLIYCLEDKVRFFSLENKNKLLELVNRLIKYNENNEILDEANKLKKLLLS